MKKIWILVMGVLMAWIVILNLIDNTDLSAKYGLPVHNWIYRIVFIILSLYCFIEYYKVNWGKSKKK